MLADRRVATNRTPREINKHYIFDLIRSHSSVSRAELSRLSGLQRSTVSIIVDELLDHQLIAEGPKRVQRGHCPTLVQLNSNRFAIAVDVRFSSFTLALVDLTGQVLSRKTVRFRADAAIGALVSGIKTIIEENRGKAIDGIGILLPYEWKVVLHNSHMEAGKTVSDLSIKSQVGQAIGLSVEVGKAADACALSEKWFSNGHGKENVVVIDVSESITIGILANGKPLRGANGRAGQDPCGNLAVTDEEGRWQALGSNRATLRYYNGLKRTSHVDDFEVLLKRARKGEKIAFEAIEKMASYLARGVRASAHLLDPEEIVITGEIVEVWDAVRSIIEAESRLCPTSKLPLLRAIHIGSAQRLRSVLPLIHSRVVL
jgi:predicted NBD/HSP70 family sugar kinase